MREDMPKPPRAEEPDKLLEKATMMLSYCKSMLGEKAGPEHFVLVAAAINIFGDKNAEEAARFVKDNWGVLDERAKGCRLGERDPGRWDRVRSNRRLCISIHHHNILWKLPIPIGPGRTFGAGPNA
jgi:hypothetical protein